MKRMGNQRGVALIVAASAVVIISITTVMLLNLTKRRFEMTSFRSDRSVALNADEGATQYIWARLSLSSVDDIEDVPDRIPPGPIPRSFRQWIDEETLETPLIRLPVIIASSPNAASNVAPQPLRNSGTMIDPSLRRPDGKEIAIQIFYDDPNINYDPDPDPAVDPEDDPDVDNSADLDPNPLVVRSGANEDFKGTHRIHVWTDYGI